MIIVLQVKTNGEYGNLNYENVHDEPSFVKAKNFLSRQMSQWQSTYDQFSTAMFRLKVGVNLNNIKDFKILPDSAKYQDAQKLTYSR